MVSNDTVVVECDLKGSLVAGLEWWGCWPDGCGRRIASGFRAMVRLGGLGVVGCDII